MKQHLPQDDVTLESLAQQLRVISLESSNDTQLLKAETARMPRFINDIKSFITRRLNPFSVDVRTVDSRKLEAAVRGQLFTKISSLGVFVPSGFEGKWLPYIALLDKSQSSVNGLYFDLLIPFEKYLAAVLTTAESLKDLSIPTPLARYKSADTAELSKEFAKFFGAGNGTEAVLGDVIERLPDIPTVTRDLNAVNVEFAKIDRRALLKRVENITDLLDKLIDNIKNHPDEYQMSATSVKIISELALYMAREVEYYTIHGYFLEAFTTSVDDSYKRLAAALTR